MKAISPVLYGDRHTASLYIKTGWHKGHPMPTFRYLRAEKLAVTNYDGFVAKFRKRSIVEFVGTDPDREAIYNAEFECNQRRTVELLYGQWISSREGNVGATDPGPDCRAIGCWTG
jgi:hypothetical protein